MSPFLQFRLWARRAPSVERVSAGLAGLVVVALLVWALVPGSGAGSGSRSVQAGGTTPGTNSSSASAQAGTPSAGAQPGAGPTSSGSASLAPASAGVTSGSGSSNSGGTAGTSSPGAAAPGGATAGAASSSSSCSNLTSTDQGVTPSQIHVGVVLVNLEGQAGNSLVGVPSPQQQQADFQAVFDSVNASGGVQCRKLVPTYYEGNPLDQAEEHATCLQIVQDKPFALLDVSAIDTPPSTRDCVPEAHIPFFDTVPLLKSEAQQQFYPYMFTYQGEYDHIMRDFAYGARQEGWFSGAQKVGILEEDCPQEVNANIAESLAEVGWSGSRVTTFDYGCPSGLIPPNEQEQAVLSFKTSGVTNVIDAVGGAGSSNDFSRVAQEQDYKPKYGIPDGGAVATFQSASFAPDPSNFNGALAITALQYGADTTPVPFSASTAKCDQIMAAGGQPPAEKQGVGFGGVACDQVWELVAGLTHDPTVTRAQLAAGLDSSGPLDFSFPDGPAVFDKPKVVTGGQFWRPVVYDGPCTCWKVKDATFRPNF